MWKCDFLWVRTVCILLTTPFNLNHVFIIIISFMLCTRKLEKKVYKKIMEGMRSSNFIWGTKRFSYEESARAKVHRLSDIYFRCSGDFWFASKFLVVFCRRICHGRDFGIRKALLHQTQRVLFVLLFIKFLEVCVKESVTNHISRGRLNINQVLSILFWFHLHITLIHIHAGWDTAS